MGSTAAALGDSDVGSAQAGTVKMGGQQNGWFRAGEPGNGRSEVPKARWFARYPTEPAVMTRCVMVRLLTGSAEPS